MATEIWKEEVQYIEDTPIRIVIDDQISVFRGRLMPHWHEEVEIDQVLKGSVYYIVNGETYRLDQGDAVIIDSGTIHSGRCSEGTTVEETEAEVMTIQINKDVFHYANYAEPSFEVFLPKEESAELRSIMTEIRTIYQQKDPYYEVLLNCNALKLCYCLLKNHNEKEKNRKSLNSINKEIKLALRFIEDHCLERLKLEDVAEQLKYNSSYFSRIFHQFTGYTFLEYLNRCRTVVAAGMLRDDEKTVSEIALDCGFANVSSFITFFKRQYGTTPEQYRRTQKQN